MMGFYTSSWLKQKIYITKPQNNNNDNNNNNNNKLINYLHAQDPV